jgi:hypothetical protein
MMPDKCFYNTNTDCPNQGKTYVVSPCTQCPFYPDNKDTGLFPEIINNQPNGK